MIYSRRPNPQVHRENIQRLLHKASAVVEWRTAIQLRRRHPKFLLGIYPHGIHPEKAFVANEDGHRPVGEDLENVLAVCVAGVDVSFCVDGSAAYSVVSYFVQEDAP